MHQCALALLLVWVAGTGIRGAELRYKERLLASLVRKVPSILDSFDPETGRFGTGVWICRDQHPMYPLAVAYTTVSAENPYHKDPKLLDVIVRAGAPLIENMNDQGQWVFRKKDGSTWGNIWMPWTYSRWVRTFQLIQEDMPEADRKVWAERLTLGYTGISKHLLHHVHNIPAHHAMGLYFAGRALDRPEWCRQASGFLRKVASAQSEGGYWAEGGGPVVRYDFVYIDALGTYYAVSGDAQVLPALEKAAAFHRQFTYPNGRSVETIDQRNPFHDVAESGNVGFTFSPAGRAYLAHLWHQRGGDSLDADLIASLLLYGQEGLMAERAGTQRKLDVLVEGGVDRALTLRRGPWFVCLSAYTTPVSTSRWIQDRQNFVSIYHEKTGLILGGGNTKLQPRWSNFTVGDIRLLAHKPGDTRPDFRPKGALYHVPSQARLVRATHPGLDLTYGPETCRIRITPADERTIELQLEATTTSDLPVAAHLTLLPRLDQTLETAAGTRVTIGRTSVHLSNRQLGAWIRYAGYRLHLPDGASLYWPALPHNPYRKDGHAGPAEGRIVIDLPFDQQRSKHRVVLEVLD